jgi:hypothetical protein
MLIAVCAAALITGMSVTAALAGEITGTGKSLKVDGGGKWDTGLHARSECAYSGQEDLQYQDDDGNPLPEPTKGVPGHAQSWGQIPMDVRAFLTTIGQHPGMACSPMR